MSESRLVYSTEHGQICPRCQRPVSKCSCKKSRNKKKSKNRQLLKSKSGFPNDGVVRITRQTKGFKGKVATLVIGIPLKDADLKNLAKTLKQRCGAGGTIKDNIIIIQGDHRPKLESELKKMGYRVKISGS